MITISSSLIRQFRAVLRRAGFFKTSPAPKNPIRLLAGADGLRIRAISGQVAVEFHEARQREPAELCVPAEFLSDAEGRTVETIALESASQGKVLASWTDRGIPQRTEYIVHESKSAQNFPEAPSLFQPNPPELLASLQDAVAVTPHERIRFALDCLQLRGSERKIVATDGHHILVQSGFVFPWSEHLLIPAAPVFGCRELAGHDKVGVGIAQDWIAWRFGPWTIWLSIERESRYPKIDDVIGKPATAVCRLSLAEADAEFLTASLTRIPNHDPDHLPITLDLNGQVIVRSRSAATPQPTELFLSRSQCQGDALTINTDRRFLARAIKLGFREMCFFGPDAPVLCDDRNRQYVWALLGSDGAISNSEDAIRIESSAYSKSSSTLRSVRPTKPSRRRFTVTAPTTASNDAPDAPKVHAVSNGRIATTQHPSNSTPIVNQTIALRAVLREALCQTNDLIRALKREKRQSRLVASTLASLKQLQNVAV